MLNVQSPVGDPFAIEYKQFFKDAIDRPIRDEGRFETFMDLTGAGIDATLKKGEPIGVEEDSLTFWKLKSAARSAIVN